MMRGHLHVLFLLTCFVVATYTQYLSELVLLTVEGEAARALPRLVRCEHDRIQLEGQLTCRMHLPFFAFHGKDPAEMRNEGAAYALRKRCD